MFDPDDQDYTNDANSKTPTGAFVVLHPTNAVQFASGFLVGTSLSGRTETLNTCENTLSKDIIAKSLVFSDNVVTLEPPKWFTAAYSMWDIFYFS